MSPKILDEAVTTDMYPSRLISKTDKILYGRRGLETFPKPPSPINMSQLKEKTGMIINLVLHTWTRNCEFSARNFKKYLNNITFCREIFLP